MKPFRRPSSFGSLVVAVALFLLLVPMSRSASEESPPGEIRVEIIEGIPDQLSWDFTAPAPGESYAEPAFAFTAMPTRYSARWVRSRARP